MTKAPCLGSQGAYQGCFTSRPPQPPLHFSTGVYMGAGEAEVFPKQDAINLDVGEVGNFINLPLFGGLAIIGRTVFVDPRNGLKPLTNQWKYLEAVNPVAESLLDEIIEVNEIEVGGGRNCNSSPVLGTFRAVGTLAPCARRMLEEGVTAYQRVSCFRLAVHLRRQGMPFDVVVAALLGWSKKNRPVEGKRVITEVEVKAQTAYAFMSEYKGCGCDEPAVAPFCDPTCSIASKRTAG